MKHSRYTEEQINGILKQHQAGLGAKDLCRKHWMTPCVGARYYFDDFRLVGRDHDLKSTMNNQA